MSTQAELQVKLATIGEKLNEASTEIVAKISELTAAIVAAGNTTPEIDALVDQALASAQSLADIVPNA